MVRVEAIDSLSPMDPVEQLRTRTHLGASGNLGLDDLRARVAHERAALDQQRAHVEQVARDLLTPKE